MHWAEYSPRTGGENPRFIPLQYDLSHAAEAEASLLPLRDGV